MDYISQFLLHVGHDRHDRRENGLEAFVGFP